jgi:hypothetical protein
MLVVLMETYCNKSKYSDNTVGLLHSNLNITLEAKICLLDIIYL